MAHYAARKRYHRGHYDDQCGDYSNETSTIVQFVNPASPPRQPKRQRPSQAVNVTANKLIDRRRKFIDELRQHLPFLVQYREQPPSSLRSQTPRSSVLNDRGVTVWVTGLNVDNEAWTLKKTTGLTLLVQYQSHYHTDALSSSALCTFLSHVSSGEITDNQLMSFFTTRPNTGKSLTSLIQRFPVMSGLDRLIYINRHDQHALLADLLTKGVRAKKSDDIPKLTKMLTPKKDTSIENVSVGANGSVSVTDRSSGAARGNSSRKQQRKSEPITNTSANAEPFDSNDSCHSLFSASSAYHYGGEIIDDSDDSSDSSMDDTNEDVDNAISNSQSAHSYKSNSASSSLSFSSPPSTTPFSVYEQVLLWWCDLKSPHYQRVQSLLFTLSTQRANIGVCELTYGDTDVELVLTRMGIRILSAMSAPTVSAALSVQDRINDILTHLHRRSSPSPIPLRLDDACVVIADRKFFERTVYPLIVAPSTMFELNEHSPVIEFFPASLSSAPPPSTEINVKNENEPTKSSSPSRSVPVMSEELKSQELKTRLQSIELVSGHVRRYCSPSSFLLYSLSFTQSSTFFPPVQCKSIFALSSSLSLIDRPCLLEWPALLPFNPSMFIQWAQYILKVKDSLLIIIVVPCRCWKSPSLALMKSEISTVIGAGAQRQNDRVVDSDNPLVLQTVNTVSMTGIFITARPALTSSRQTRLTINDDGHYFVLHLQVKTMSVGVHGQSSSASVPVLNLISERSSSIPPLSPATELSQPMSQHARQSTGNGHGVRRSFPQPPAPSASASRPVHSTPVQQPQSAPQSASSSSVSSHSAPFNRSSHPNYSGQQPQNRSNGYQRASQSTSASHSSFSRQGSPSRRSLRQPRFQSQAFSSSVHAGSSQHAYRGGGGGDGGGVQSNNWQSSQSHSNHTHSHAHYNLRR